MLQVQTPGPDLGQIQASLEAVAVPQEGQFVGQALLAVTIREQEIQTEEEKVPGR